MPHGFFTIEQWKRLKRGGRGQWVPVAHLTADKSLTDALHEIESRNRPGFYRIIQTQRMIWAEKKNGKLHLRKHHTGSPKSLARAAAAFVRDKGKWPAKSR